MSEFGLDKIFQLLRDVYGTERRKGLFKFAYEHPHDVVQYSFLEMLGDPPRAARLLRVALLHDVVEDGLELGDVAAEIDLDEEEVRLLAILSRNVGHPDGSEYWEGIFSTQDAVIVKLADRIANLRDLIAWVRMEEGFSSESLPIFEKYRTEYELISSLLRQKYPNKSDCDNHPFGYQIPFLQTLMEILETLHTVYLHDPQSFGKRTTTLLATFDELVEVMDATSRTAQVASREQGIHFNNGRRH